MDEIVSRLDRLEAESARLRQELIVLAEEGGPPTPVDRSVSRRALLRQAGTAAVSVGAGLALAVPTAVRAANDDPVLAGRDTASSSDTVVTSSAPRGLVGRTNATAPANNHTPSGVVGIVGNAAGQNFDDAPSGVLGISSKANGFNAGVQGYVSSPNGIGVVGRAPSTGNGTAVGVYGESANGVGVHGVGRETGVYAEAIGDGSTGVSGSGHGYGVTGSANGQNAIGVSGTGVAPGGRGGVFSGTAAQLRLVPSTATTHPHSGKAGDLFLDKGHRLWLSKGGTTWTRIG